MTFVVVSMIYTGTVLLCVGTAAWIVRAWTRRRYWHKSPSDLHYIAVGWLGKNVDRVVDLGGGDLVVLEKAGLLHGVQQWRVVSQEHEQQGDFGFSEGGLGGSGGTVQATQAKMSEGHT
jgi:hypothetical protein